MKKILKSIIIVCLFAFLLGGCLSREQIKEAAKMERETKKLMKDYLKKNYQVSRVSNVQAKYRLTGDLAPATFTDNIVGYFKKDNQTNIILCVYSEKKCYDTLTYEKDVMPFLINEIYNDLKQYNINIRPSIVKIYTHDILEYSDILKLNHYGVYSKEDSYTNYADIQKNFHFWNLDIIYKNSQPILSDIYQDVAYFHEKFDPYSNLIIETWNGDELLERLAVDPYGVNYELYVGSKFSDSYGKPVTNVLENTSNK